MLTKILVISGSLSAVALFLVTQFTTPASIHPVGLLGVFVLIYVVAASIMTFVIYLGSRALGTLASNISAMPKTGNPIPVQRAYLYGTVLAFAPVVLIGMRSVGNLGFIDVLLIVVFELIACFYIWRR